MERHTGAFVAPEINNVGGVDETWYNPTDNKYYLAARDMPKARSWASLMLAQTTGCTTFDWIQCTQHLGRSQTNHAFVPLQSGAHCTTLGCYGCVGVDAQQ